MIVITAYRATPEPFDLLRFNLIESHPEKMHLMFSRCNCNLVALFKAGLDVKKRETTEKVSGSPKGLNVE
jgi:hypothetical protein